MTKVLIIKMSSMGDIIHTFPALRDLKDNDPSLECHWVVEEEFIDIANINNDIDHVIVIALRRWRNKLYHYNTWKEISNFIRLLREHNYEYIIDPQGILKSAFLSLLARGNTYGYAIDTIREKIASYFYQHKILLHNNNHAITKIRLLFASIFSYSINQKIVSYNLSNYTIELNNYLPSQYIFFLHGTSKQNKCWAVTKWHDLAKRYAATGMTVVCTYSNEKERIIALEITQDIPLAICLPKMSLWELAYIIRKATGLVGVDTGLVHLGAAYDIPMISLYGPTPVELIGTIGKYQQHLNLYTASTNAVQEKLDILIALKNNG